MDTVNPADSVRPIQRVRMPLHCALFLDKRRFADPVVGDETFRLVSLQGQETVAGPFEFQAELHGNSSHRGLRFTLQDLVGRPITFGIEMPARHEKGQTRFFDEIVRGTRSDAASLARFSFFNGIVASFALCQPGVYQATVKPALWKLTLTNRYRLFRRKSVREVIDAVLGEAGIACDLTGISGDDNPAVVRIQDWMQAGESDYEFVERMLGKAHIYYYFVHAPDGHTAVFANRPAYRDVPGDGGGLELRYSHTTAEGEEQDDLLTDYSYRCSLGSSGVRSVFVRPEEAWEQQPAATYHVYDAESGSDLGERPFHLYKVYQYGQCQAEVANYNRATYDAMRTGNASLSGGSTNPLLHPGYRFGTVAKADPLVHPHLLDTWLDGRQFVLTQVSHQASADGSYHNQFEATDASGFIAKFDPRDAQQGSVLAEVVAHGKAQAPGDWRYYAPDAFDPETSEMDDPMSKEQPVFTAKGVYVRFVTDPADAEPVWIKLSSNMQSVPEVGATVTIGRAYDASELPEVQGTIQSNGSMTVMPTGWNSNTHVGSNFSTSYGDGKSIRYGASSSLDLDSAKSMVEQAYQQGGFRDVSYSKGGSWGYSTTDKGDAGMLSQSESHGCTHNKSYGVSSYNYSEIGTSENHSTVGVSTSESTVTGSESSKQLVLGPSSRESTSLGSSTSLQFSMGPNLSVGMTGPSVNSQVNFGPTLSTSLSLLGSINLGVTLGDTLSDQTHLGVSINSQFTAESVNASLTGMQASMNVVGESSSISLTGATEGVNIVGSATDVSVQGETTHIGVVGEATNVNIAGSVTNVTLNGEVNNVDLSPDGVKVNISPSSIQCEAAGMTITIPIVMVMYI
jgi:type VI secretion system secreted protein VgrG